MTTSLAAHSPAGAGEVLVGNGVKPHGLGLRQLGHHRQTDRGRGNEQPFTQIRGDLG